MSLPDWDVLVILEILELEVRVVILLVGIELGVVLGVRVVSVRELLEVVTHEVDGAGYQYKPAYLVGNSLVTGDLEHDDVSLGKGDVEVGLLDLECQIRPTASPPHC
jgi:hypothetical protein